MKFFTKKMWFELQNDERSDYWSKIWQRNIKLYNRYLQELKQKLSKRVLKFFSDYHRHGDYIVGINIINNGKTHIQKETNEIHLINSSRKSVEIDITILCPTRSFYILQYRGVKKYIIDYPSNEPLGFDGGCDTWGYDELSYLKNSYFQHEILLHSGATILIEFKKFNYSAIKINDNLKIKNKRWQELLKKNKIEKN